MMNQIYLAFASRDAVGAGLQAPVEPVVRTTQSGL